MLTDSSRSPTSSRRLRGAPGAGGAALRPVDEELRVEGDAAIRAGVELHHPAVDALGIELRVDGAIERVGEVDALAVAADLDHLRAAVERAVLGAPDGWRATRCRRSCTLPVSFGLERIGDVVLVQVARSPAGDVEEAVVHRQVDVGDERRHGLEALEHRRQQVRIGRLGRDVDDLLHRPFAAVAVPGPDRGRQVLQADDAVDEAVGLGRVVRRPQLEHELVLLAEVDLLQVLALVQVPEMQPAAILRAEQHLRDRARSRTCRAFPIRWSPWCRSRDATRHHRRAAADRGRSPIGRAHRRSRDPCRKIPPGPLPSALPSAVT